MNEDIIYLSKLCRQYDNLEDIPQHIFDNLCTAIERALDELNKNK